MTIIEYSDDDGDSWSEINFDDYRLFYGNGRKKLGNKLIIFADPRTSVTSGDLVRISVDDDYVFEGKAKNSGRIKDGEKRKEVTVYGYEYFFFEEEVSVDLSSVAPHEVIEEVLPSSWSLNYSDSGISIDFDVEDTKKKIIKRMIDRANYVTRINSYDKTMHFNPRGDRGDFDTYDGTYSRIQEYEEDDVNTIINHVVVYGTYKNNKLVAENDVTSDVEDSRDAYGKRSKTYNAKYIQTESEAKDLSNQLLQLEPLDTGKIRVTTPKYDPSNIVNHLVDVVDDTYNVSSTLEVVEQQVRENRMILDLGQGVDFGSEEGFRSRYSDNDKTESGATYGGQLGNNINDEEENIVNDDLSTSKHSNFVNNSITTSGSADTDTTYTNDSGQDILISTVVKLVAEPGDIAYVELNVDEGDGLERQGEAYLGNDSGNGDSITTFSTETLLVPAGADYRYDETLFDGSGSSVSIDLETIAEIKTE